MKTSYINQIINLLIKTELKTMRVAEGKKEKELVVSYTTLFMEYLVGYNHADINSELTGKHAEARDKIVQILNELFAEEVSAEVTSSSVEVPPVVEEPTIVVLSPEAQTVVSEPEVIQDTASMCDATDVLAQATNNLRATALQTIIDRSTMVEEIPPGAIARLSPELAFSDDEIQGLTGHSGIDAPKMPRFPVQQSEHDERFRV